mgnify:CR=1 FL=1
MLIRSRAPLRLGLAGGGTDNGFYSAKFGGCVVNAAINLSVHCTLEPAQDGRIVFTAADVNESISFDADGPLPKDGSCGLHLAVYHRVLHQFLGGNSRSFRMTTYSDVPQGSGLGASSALAVAMLKAYAEWLHLPLAKEDLARLAYEIERLEYGLAGGMQDQYAAAFGGFNVMHFHRNGAVSVHELGLNDWVERELENSLVLYYTGILRDAEAVIREQTDNASRNQADSLNAMHQLKRDAQNTKESLLRGDLRQFAVILGRSWEAKKRTASRMTNPEIERIYESALQAGALAGKVSGAGGGGFMLFAVDPVRRPSLARALGQFQGTVLPFSFTKQGAHSWKVMDSNLQINHGRKGEEPWKP